MLSTSGFLLRRNRWRLKRSESSPYSICSRRRKRAMTIISLSGRYILWRTSFSASSESNLRIILEQARSYGIGAILSNHSAAQLRTDDGKDLWPLINGNTAATLHFGSKDLAELEMLSRLSGEVEETRTSYAVSHGRSQSTAFLHGLTDTEGSTETVSYSSQFSQRFMIRDLLRIFSRRRRFILSVQRNTGFSRFNGEPVVVDGIYTMSKETYQRRQKARWPDGPLALPGAVQSPKTEFVQARPSREMLEKIRVLTLER